MKLLTTTQLAAKLKVTTGCVRQWKREGRLTPAGKNVRGEPLYLATERKPARRRTYPKRVS